MHDEERLKSVEQAPAQMLKPLKGIPFSTIVKSLAECQVIAIDRTSAVDAELLNRLETAVSLVVADLRANPIR